MIRIEFEPPHRTTCECCGEHTTRLTRFVYNDDAAYAVYYASYAHEHPDEVRAVISIGEWGDGSTPRDRVAFAVRLWQNELERGVTVDSAVNSLWKNVDLIGRVLDRDEALAHPRIGDAFHITDHMFADDPEIDEFFRGSGGQT